MNCKRNRFCFLTFIAGIVLLCPFYGPSAKANVNLVELVKEIQPAVVTVITYDKDENLLGQGSGFFIDDKGHVITNYHILVGAYSAKVKACDGKAYPVKLVVAENENIDLIKVSVDMPEKAVKFVQLTNTAPEVAERVLVIGSPMGLEQTVSEGIVSAVRDIPTIGKIFQISAPISPGSSGSPVVDMEGKVIGVATFQFIEGQNLNFAVSGEHVLALKSEKESKTLMEWASRISKNKMDAVKNPLRKGIGFFWAGKYETALESFKEVTKEYNRFPEACIVLAPVIATSAATRRR